MNPRAHRGWQRKCILCLAFCIASTTGCQYGHHLLLNEAVTDGRIPELSSATRYTYQFPGAAELERYRRVELLNVYITTTEGTKVCSFVFGESRADDLWEIVSGSIRGDDGTWRELEIRPRTQSDKVALGAKSVGN